MSKQPARQSGDEHWTRRQPERVARGPDAAGAKLSAAQIGALCADWSAGQPKKTVLARRYGVSRVTVWRVLKERGLT